MTFHKFHGAGNDFILVDNRGNVQYRPSLINHLCNRHTGIGADGFILLEEDDGESDFFMRYFNSDGIEASLCGNGSRCAVAFAHELRMITEETTFRAFDGLHHARIISHGDELWDIALQLADVANYQVFADGYFLDTGSPHFVTFQYDLNTLDILHDGKKLRHDTRFDQGCNVNFVSPCRDGIEVRTYERGVENETLSCGTGVTAAALAWAINEQLPDNSYKIPVYTKGGLLQVAFTLQDDIFTHIVLQGPATRAFTGEVLI